MRAPLPRSSRASARRADVRERRVARALRATRRDERGVAFPSPVVALSLLAVAMAGVAFVATDDGGGREEVVTVSRPSEPDVGATPEQTDEPTPQPVQKSKPVKKKPVVQRGETYVVVFNNTNVAGLAGSVADRVQGAGWQVVGSDNWVGTIPATTVYYPPRLEEAGRMLARDLGVQRLRPAVEPMQFDRLTVILTGSV